MTNVELSLQVCLSLFEALHFLISHILKVDHLVAILIWQRALLNAVDQDCQDQYDQQYGNRNNHNKLCVNCILFL